MNKRLQKWGGDSRLCISQCAVTPATNTLPIRRLNLQIGGSKSVIAAWVKFPDLRFNHDLNATRELAVGFERTKRIGSNNESSRQAASSKVNVT